MASLLKKQPKSSSILSIKQAVLPLMMNKGISFLVIRFHNAF